MLHVVTKGSADAAFAKAYARARLAFADAVFDESMLIADLKPKDKIGVAHQRLRVDTRLKIVAKINPERYGDRLNLNHSGTVGVSFAGIDDERLNAMLEKRLLDLGLLEFMRERMTADEFATAVSMLKVIELPTAAPDVKPEGEIVEGQYRRLGAPAGEGADGLRDGDRQGP